MASDLRRRIERTARERFGFEFLRPGQSEAIEAAIAGRDCLAVMSTGQGKSAIYQTAGELIDGLTVVVSPLVALQREQVESLTGRERAGAAAQLSSSVRESERREALAELEEGRAQVPADGTRAARQPRRPRADPGGRAVAVRGRRGALHIGVGS